MKFLKSFYFKIQNPNEKSSNLIERGLRNMVDVGDVTKPILLNKRPPVLHGFPRHLPVPFQSTFAWDRIWLVLDSSFIMTITVIVQEQFFISSPSKIYQNFVIVTGGQCFWINKQCCCPFKRCCQFFSFKRYVFFEPFLFSLFKEY